MGPAHRRTRPGREEATRTKSAPPRPTTCTSSGYICLGWCWLVAAGVAAKKLAEDPSDDFYMAKLVTARHYFARILPRVDSHAAAARAGAAGLMALTADQFAIA